MRQSALRNSPRADILPLGLRCTMDGLGIAFGDNLLGHPDVGLVAGISVHKIPEGLALILLLLELELTTRKRWRGRLEWRA